MGTTGIRAKLNQSKIGKLKQTNKRKQISKATWQTEQKKLEIRKGTKGKRVNRQKMGNKGGKSGTGNTGKREIGSKETG